MKNKQLQGKEEDLKMSFITQKRAIADKDAVAQAWANEKQRTKANTIAAIQGPSLSGQLEGDEVENLLAKFE